MRARSLLCLIALTCCAACSGKGGSGAGPDAGPGAGGRGQGGASAAGGGSAGTGAGGGGGGVAGGAGGGGGGGVGGAGGGAAAAGGIAAQPACIVDGWCWENPLPQGNRLRAVHGSGRNDVWAVGEKGSVVHFDGTSWSGVASGTFDSLRGVWAARPGEAWIASSETALLRWDGAAWTQTNPPASASFASAVDAYAVAGFVDGSVSPPAIAAYFAGVSYGGLFRFANGAWTGGPAINPPFAMDALWVDGAGRLWAAGFDGGVAVLSGTAWSYKGSVGAVRLLAVAGDAAGNTWVSGEGGFIARVDSRGAIGMFSTGSVAVINGLWAASPTDAWAVGAGGAILRWTGAEWIAQPSGTAHDLFAVWGSAADDVWAVGDNGVILHFDGRAWSPPNGATNHHLHAVWGAAADDLWAVGDAGTILRRDAAGWRRVDGGTAADLAAVWGAAAGDVWMGGTNVLVHWNGQALAADTGGPQYLAGLHGRGTSDVWATGRQTSRWDGSRWNTIATDGGAAIWEASPADVWQVPAGQMAVRHWNGASFTTTALTRPCFALWGAASNDVWCGGGGTFGQIFRYDGNTWRALSAAGDSPLNGLHGSASTNVWFAGNGGLVGTCNQDQCSARGQFGAPGQRTFTHQNLLGVWVLGDHDVWVVGTDGAILRRHF